jgi:hypothetical protein
VKHSSLFILTALATLGSAPVQAQSIRPNPGFNSSSIPANDDGSSGLEPLGFTINFFGKLRSSGYVNNNGNITFDNPLATYTPFGLVKTEREIIAPFFADVDTRAGALVTYGRDTVNGHQAFGANYINVGYFAKHSDKLNSFQVVLIDRSDTGAGNFDIEFNYGHILWETGDASGGVGGYGGVPATVGWSNGDPDSSYQLPGSLISGQFLDGGPHALFRQTVNASGKAAVPGRLIYRARDGQISPGLSITSSILPDAVLAQSYFTNLTATGATGALRWTLTPDVTAPPGLTVSQDGKVTGVPNDTGTYSFTLSVTANTEDGELTAYQRGSITIHPAVISILTTCPLEGGSVGRPYSVALRATGSSSGYSWSVNDRYSLPSGIGLSPDGVLAGTPFVPGTYIFDLSARSLGSTDSQPAHQLCHLTISPAAVRLASGCTLPKGTVDVPYSQLLSASGGIAPYRYQLIGQLPAGLALAPDGQIAGTPRSAVSFPFELSVRDAAGTQTAQDCSITVDPPAFDVSSACPLPAGKTGAAYNAKLPSAYTWSLNGTLPAGLELSPDGTVSGTPMTAGPFRFLLVATDGGGNQVAQACSLLVARGPLGVGGCPLPDASAGKDYQTSLTGLGGSAPYFFTIAGALPAGMNFSSLGVLSGVATAPGLYPFDVTVREGSGQTFTQACRLNVNPTVLRITSCPLPKAQLGQSYAARVSAEGGLAPYRFEFLGFLPDGLRAGSDGSVTGTPQALGGQSFQVRLTDSQNSTVNSACSVNVALPPIPQIRITGLPATAAPASTNVAVTVEIDNTYTQPIEGQVDLSIQPDTRSSEGAANQADPRLSFANGQPTAKFSIAPGSKQVKLPLVSTGTVASTVTLALSHLRSAGVDLPLFPSAQKFSIVPSAPVVTSACYSRTPTGVNFEVNGYSTTRELKRADVSIGTEKLQIDLAGLATDFFAAPVSIRNGGTFALTVPRDMTMGTTVPEISMQVYNTIGGAGARTLTGCQ